jgi:LPS-assembly protein
MLTNCKLPKPIWTLKGPKFDIIPGDRALVYKSRFRVRNVPLFYAPVFYKSLQERPRKSGFLTPNIGNSSRRGFMLGAGYYWAINRSYDASYRVQYFSQRGFAHHVNARAKPTQRSTFDAYFYGVADRGKDIGGGRKIDAGGFLVSVTGDADLGKGWQSRWDVNYLSSYLFRQEFTESFNEAVFSEVHSVAYVTKNWSNYGLDAVFRRSENFYSTLQDDKISIRKLPEFRFTMRDREVSRKVLPVTVSMDSQFGLLSRDQPLFQTRRWVERIDVAPRVSTAIRIKDISIIPAVSVRGTHYDSSWQNGQVSGDGVLRTSGEFTTELRLPSLGRVYDGPKWIGDKVKHVVEARAGYRYIGGIDSFHRYILFDETETYSNTSELDYSLINRIYTKRNGVVHEALTWELWQARFFDEDFSGAVIDGQRNVLNSAQRLTGYAFLDGARAWSPVVSNVRMSPRPGWGISSRTDYDTLFHRFSNASVTADARIGGKYFFSVGANRVNTNPVLTPPANQVRGLVVLGDPNKRGWNGAFSAIYDFRQDIMQFATTQLTYNTGCCGISFQYRRFGFGTRQENQFRVAFAISNIGSFGTLKKQERLF